MRKTPPRISDAEWQVMEVIWSLGNARSVDLIERLGPETGWNPKTIRTLLARLVRKGALTHAKDGREYVYRAVFTQAQCVRSRSESFLANISEHLTVPVLMHFVKRARLSRDEIDLLRKTLDEKGKL